MRYTKGNWINRDGLIENGVRTIASVNQGISSNDREEFEANAKLIAAAPELLRALKIASLHVSSVSNYGDWNLIQNAIEKATE